MAPLTDYSTLGDEELVAKLRTEDEDAAAALYHRYSDSVYAQLKRKLSGVKGRSGLDISDLKEAAFMSLFKAVKRTPEVELVGERVVKLLMRIVNCKAAAWARGKNAEYTYGSRRLPGSRRSCG